MLIITVVSPCFQHVNTQKTLLLFGTPGYPQSDFVWEATLRQLGNYGSGFAPDVWATAPFISVTVFDNSNYIKVRCTVDHFEFESYLCFFFKELIYIYIDTHNVIILEQANTCKTSWWQIIFWNSLRLRWTFYYSRATMFVSITANIHNIY